MEQTANNQNAIDCVERWALAAANSLHLEAFTVEEARAQVAACIGRVDYWGCQLAANDQGAVRALSCALARAACKRLGGSIDATDESDLDRCVFWIGRALDYADSHTRLKSAGARYDAVYHLGACFERAEVLRVQIGREHGGEAALVLRLIQQAREVAKDIVIGASGVKAAA